MTGDENSARRRHEVRELIDSWHTVPAFVRDRYLTVIASNELARAISPSFHEGVNLARFTFLDPSITQVGAAWTAAADAVAAILRDSVDQHEADVSFRTIVGELSAKSRSFAEAWAGDVPVSHNGVAYFDHEVVGRLTLNYHQLRIPEDFDEVLVVLRASGAESQTALSRLIDVVSGS